jgi:hypothetical protein
VMRFTCRSNIPHLHFKSVIALSLDQRNERPNQLMSNHWPIKAF